MCSSDLGATITGAGTYNYGEQVTLSVTTFTDYVFEHWSENGEVVSTAPAYTFTVTANRHLVANLLYTEGLDEMGAQAGIFPNPSTDGFTVICEGMSLIQVFSMDGRLVQSFETRSDLEQIKGLAQGSYLLRITKGSETLTRKIVKF